MQSITSPCTVSPPSVPFVFDPACLYARLRTLSDGRDPRGAGIP